MKPRDAIWNFYNLVEEGKNTKAVCKECNTEVSAKVIRLRSHRFKCPAVCKPQTATKRPAVDSIEESQPSEQEAIISQPTTVNHSNQYS